MELSAVGKSLHKLLSVSNHPLEVYVQAIDHNLENKSLLRVIGEKIGIDVFNDPDPAFSLYIILKDFLERETDVEKTRRIVHMSRDEFAKLFSDLSSDKLYTAYANRLLEL
tara:strand:+ start:409 stop:741 length:333 start_codon:yes stop_codon:yes gene_type:complete